MKKLLFLALTASFLLTLGLSPAKAQTESVIEPGKTIKIDDSYSYIFEFAEKPKLGPATLRVQLLNQKGEKVNNLSIAVYSYMVTMKGHHDERRLFAVNSANQNYLTAITFVMRGQYRLELSFFNDGKLYHTGVYDIKI
jgi:hypothetical protein